MVGHFKGCSVVRAALSRPENTAGKAFPGYKGWHHQAMGPEISQRLAGCGTLSELELLQGLADRRLHTVLMR